MIAYVQNKILTIGGSSKVLDEKKNLIYEVKGKIISPTKKKLIYDTNGELKFVVRNKYWHFLSVHSYVFDANHKKLCKISKGSWSFNRKFKISECDGEMELVGKFGSREYKLMKNGEQMGTITKDFSIIDDSFIVEGDEADIPFLCALTIAFDNLIDKRRDQNK